MNDPFSIPPELSEGYNLKGVLADLFQAAGSDQEVLSARLRHLLPDSPHPIQSLLLLASFLENAKDAKIRKVLFGGEVLGQLLALYAHSQQLGFFLNKKPELLSEIFPVIREESDEFARRLSSLSFPSLESRAPSILRRLRSVEYIRILVSDVLKFDTFQETTEKISAVADRTFQLACEAVGLEEAPLAVIAMGKWGGKELNYSSDIDLLWVARDFISEEKILRFEGFAKKAIALINDPTEDGVVYRVDTQIRPDGQSGALIRTLRQYASHYTQRALPWEIQSLIKARAVACDSEIGAEFLKLTRPYIYARNMAPETLLAEVRAMKGKIEQSLVVKKKDLGNVKLGAGGIRDIEFLVQFLQIHHGQANENLRVGGTRRALRRMRVHNILTEREYDTLVSEYEFLRILEHFLQVDRLEPVRQLPVQPQELAILARKLGLSTEKDLSRSYEESCRRVRFIFFDVFDATLEFLSKKDEVKKLAGDLKPDSVDRHFNSLEADYFLRFQPREIIAHVALLDGLSVEFPCQVHSRRLEQMAGRLFELTVVAYDALGLFSKICGVVSLSGLNIIEGESYTCRERQEKEKSSFYRRASKEHPHFAEARREKPGERRKIIAVFQVESLAGGDPDSAKLQTDLTHYLELLYQDHVAEANAEISLRAIENMRKLTPAGPVPDTKAWDLSHFTFRIDNDSDRLYTVLEIESPDAFMFLFEFTHILAQRNYYLGKIQFDTLAGTIRDRLFLTTRDGSKIVENYRMNELLVTMTLIRTFAAYLPFAPNPELALSQFAEFLDLVGSKGESFFHDREVMENFARMLGSSVSIWEDLFRRHSDVLLPALKRRRKDEDFSREALEARLRSELDAAGDTEARFQTIRTFRDTEMFKIDLRHLIAGQQDFSRFSTELSSLADLLVTAAAELAIKEELGRSGMESPPGTWALFALGKWGGIELGYASDIEWIWVYEPAPAWKEKADEVGIFFEKVVLEILRRLKSSRSGIFEMDLRLRPDGEKSPHAVSFTRFKTYYAPSGKAENFERQAVTRFRQVVGDPGLAAACEKIFLDLIYDPKPFDLENLLHLRKRQRDELVPAGKTNVKYSAGGLLDLEYFIQALQIRAGDAMRGRHTPNILAAGEALAAMGVFSQEILARFRIRYGLLRNLIDALRIVRGHERDLLLPASDSVEFKHMERRLRTLFPLPEREGAESFIRKGMEEAAALFDTLPDYFKK